MGNNTSSAISPGTKAISLSEEKHVETLELRKSNEKHQWNILDNRFFTLIWQYF
jgi:hypothetical protein